MVANLTHCIQLYSGEDEGEWVHRDDSSIYLSWWPTWHTVHSCTVWRMGVSEYTVMTLPYICHGGQTGRLCTVVQWGGWGWMSTVRWLFPIFVMVANLTDCVQLYSGEDEGEWVQCDDSSLYLSWWPTWQTVYSCTVGRMGLSEYSVMTLPYICYCGKSDKLGTVVQWGGWGWVSTAWWLIHISVMVANLADCVQLYSGEDEGEWVQCDDFSLYLSWWQIWQTVYSCTVGRMRVSEYSVMNLPYICHGGQPGRLCIVVLWGGWGWLSTVWWIFPIFVMVANLTNWVQLYCGEDEGEWVQRDDSYIYLSWWPTWQTVYSCTVGRMRVSEYSVMTPPYICHGGQPGRMCTVVQWGGWGWVSTVWWLFPIHFMVANLADFQHGLVTHRGQETLVKGRLVG